MFTFARRMPVVPDVPLFSTRTPSPLVFQRFRRSLVSSRVTSCHVRLGRHSGRSYLPSMRRCTVAFTMRESLHATTLRRLFRHILIGTIVLPMPLGFMLACGSAESIADADADAGADANSVGPCRALYQRNAARGCGKAAFPVLLAGDLSTCDDGGAVSSEACGNLCGESVRSCSRTGNRLQCEPFPCAVDGRRYRGLDDRAAPNARDIGSYLSRMAFFEAASVDAFAILERDLGALGAPKRLVQGCRDAKRDEARHARMAASLATSYGGTPPESVLHAHPHRDLEQLAIENAVEGCVRETFGVLIGMWQSVAAPTADLRAFFGAITNDELRHAALSARIDAWARTALSPAAIARLDAATEDALVALETSLRISEPVAGLGIPSAGQAVELFSGLRAARKGTGVSDGALGESVAA